MNECTVSCPACGAGSGVTGSLEEMGKAHVCRSCGTAVTLDWYYMDENDPERVWHLRLVERR